MIEKEVFNLEKLNRASKDTLIEALGIVYTKIEEGLVEAIMPVETKTCQPFGLLHGGASLTLAETVAGVGSNCMCEQDSISVGIQVAGNHLAPSYIGDTIIAKGELIHCGRKTHLWNVDLFSQKNQKLIATVRVSNSIIKKKRD